jgi:hypothetical protein
MTTGCRILFTRNINEFKASRVVVSSRCCISYGEVFARAVSRHTVVERVEASWKH